MVTTGTGATLRQARLAQGYSVEEIARQTRISQKFLEAIEVEAFERLPGLVFTRNFVRQYATFLKLDPEPLLERIPRVDLESAPLPNPAYYARPRQNAGWISAASPYVWVAVAGMAVVGGYVYVERPSWAAFGNQRAERATGVRTSAQVAAVPTATTPAAAFPVTPTASPSKPTETQDALEGAAAPVPAAPETENRAVQVVLKAREASWVQIVADGKTAFIGMLHPNDSRVVAADALVRVTAGNAGGLEISLNGKSLDPLGTTGQVRTVRLTAGGPEVVQRTTTPSPL